MMRSLFSGVAGLKTHQTRMDVIGNNIANVNTTAYKSQNMVFSDLLYQTTQAASGANANTGRGGINPRQIGLGSKTGAISTAITSQGSAQSTNNPWDVMLEGNSFFIVSDGSQNFFTRDGAFTVDGAGNLVMANLGYTVMGWQVNPETGEIQKDVVSALQVMKRENQESSPEATTMGYIAGILDKTDPNINSSSGLLRTIPFYDAQGYRYTAQFSFRGIGSEDEFRVKLEDIWDETGVSLVKKYGLNNIEQIANFGGSGVKETTTLYTMDKNATFDGVDTYNLTIAFDTLLDGYANNSMLMAAGKGNVTVTSPAVGGTVTAGAADSVTVHGKVSLKKEQLEAEPYNLIYNDKDGKYYQKVDGQPLGTPIETADDWQAALKKMKGLEGVENVTVSPTTDGEQGEMTIEFDAKFTPLQNATLKDTSSFGIEFKMPDQEKEILSQIYHLEDGDGKTYKISQILPTTDGKAQITETETFQGMSLVFDHKTGMFSYIGSPGNETATLTFNGSAASLDGTTIDLGQFRNIEIDFSQVKNLGNGQKSTIEMTNGSRENSALGAGRAPGELIGIEIGTDGRITATYSNGLSKLLGQIAVAEFANASGLSKAGNNLYSATMNSGEFDGTGKDVTESGGSMTSGVLEMSNVDLSSEFTTMITTQRGFQANSRIITTSDTLLEELVNLKR